MFETNNDVMEFFSKFKDFESSADMRSSRALEQHAMMVIYTMDEAISNLDDMEYVINMLSKVAQTHSNKFDEENIKIFWKIHDPFLLAVKEALGDRFSISLENTYRIVIRYIISTMVKALGEKLGSIKTLHLDDIINSREDDLARKPIQPTVTRLHVTDHHNVGRKLQENEKEAVTLTLHHTYDRSSLSTVKSPVRINGPT